MINYSNTIADLTFAGGHVHPVIQSCCADPVGGGDSDRGLIPTLISIKPPWFHPKRQH